MTLNTNQFRKNGAKQFSIADAPTLIEPLYTDEADRGTHVVCSRVTAEFLDYSASRGNDLTTPRPEHRFTGLKPGDRWCLCAVRWKESAAAGKAPPVILQATHAKALELVSLAQLQLHALPGPIAGTGTAS